ncbi:hypothetical protein IQ244_08310 [Nostoc sp. LEGE 06077]|uniref:hypothetical protein n=1 Tax=Nostoc sp. LEGE 06077 TaxID=915325 RepID=UPI00187EC18B|nr:hypothetical protein [Nostoc sp. LEGE 06077]MBE9206517.1 hypothetical protein [Nostoc sp. LEGE 06077]
MGKTVLVRVRYDDTPVGLPPKPSPAQQNLPATSPKVIASKETNTVVDQANPFTIDISSERLEQLGVLKGIIPNLPTPKEYTVKIDVTYTGQPYNIYEVYLNLPNQDSSSDISSFFVD